LTRPAALVLALALAGCSTDAAAPEPPNLRAGVEALIVFARDPGDATWSELQLAEHVALGLGEMVRASKPADELRDPAAWTLNVDLFRGRAGTASALELIRGEAGRLSVTRGPHRHCAAPPVPPPAEAAGLTRFAIQPRDADGCLDWWTVDAFLDDEGRIRVVTLDLWEP
jgi:hypothetical protein